MRRPPLLIELWTKWLAEINLPLFPHSDHRIPSVQDLVQYWFQGNEELEMRCSKCEEAGEADVGHTYTPSHSISLDLLLTVNFDSAFYGYRGCLFCI